MQPSDTSLEPLVLVDDTNGITIIPQLAELRRLNWFDGKLLRADDLRIEQDHLRALVRRASAAGGRGVVHGLTCSLGGVGEVQVGPGFAVDPSGRSLVLPVPVPLDIQQLIDRTAGVGVAAPASNGDADGAEFSDCFVAGPGGQPTVGGGRWYVITVGWAEGLCGSEDVYGKLCENACTTSTDRPWRMDGLVFRARPVWPQQPLAKSIVVALDGRHERSLVASALFADEREDAGSMIFGDGLRGGVWCNGAGADAPYYDDVPIALIARAGGVTAFLDVWTARRERIEPPPRRYWAGCMAMRPWDVFLAQIFQFQCQLGDVLEQGSGAPAPGSFDPCGERQVLLEELLAELAKRASDSEEGGDKILSTFTKRAISLREKGAGGSQRVLIDRGIVELPPAGYLPVELTGPTVEAQVRALLGGGVDLTFCTTRADAIARALEEAQHLDRISLLRGLDNPKQREQVEIIVPDAEVQTAVAHDGWHGRLETQAAAGIHFTPLAYDGAGRVVTDETLSVYWAGVSSAEGEPAQEVVDGEPIVLVGRDGAWFEVTADRDPRSLVTGESMRIDGSGDMVSASDPEEFPRIASFGGTFKLLREPAKQKTGVLMFGEVAANATMRDGPLEKPSSEWSKELKGVHATILSSTTAAGDVVLTLTLPIRQHMKLVAVVSWHGEADTVDLSLRLDEAAQKGTVTSTEFARMTLERAAGAATAGHPDRISSEQALAALEDAVPDPGLAEAASHKLFPEPDAVAEMRATRDWVLFRRRAVLRCGEVAVAPTPPPTKIESVAVWGTGSNPDSKPDLLGKLTFAPGGAEIAGGGEALHALVVGAIKKGDELIAIEFLAGASGGEELSKARGENLARLLGDVLLRRDGFEITPVAVLPVGQGAASGDMLIRVGAPVKVAAVAIIVLDPSGASPYLRSMMVTTKEPADVREALKETMKTAVRLRDQIDFPEGSGVPTDDQHLAEIVEMYETELDAPVQALHLLSVTGDAAAGPLGVRENRLATVAGQFKYTGKTLVVDRAEEEFTAARKAGIDETTIIIVVPKDKDGGKML